VRARHHGRQRAGAPSASPAVVGGMAKQTIRLELHLPCHFGWPYSSLEGSGSHRPAARGFAAKLGLGSIVVSQQEELLEQRETYLPSFPIPPSWGCSSCCDVKTTAGEMRGEILP